MNTYVRYKHLKSDLHFVYRGFIMDEILAIRIWQYCQYGTKNRLSFNKRKSYGNLFELKKNNLFIYGKYSRKDHEYTFDCVYTKIEDTYDAVKLDHFPDVRYYSIKNYMVSFYLIFVHLKTYRMDIRSKIFFWSCYCYIMNTIDFLESQHKRRLKKLLCFSAIHEDENILKQYFHNHGAVTYSMFHGTNIQQIHNITIDCLAYENLNVEFSLPWGQYGKDEFIKTGIAADKLIVVGYPRNITLQPLNQKSQMKRCLVLMSRSIFESSDVKLMNLLSGFKNTEFSIKLHPSCNESRFASLCNEYGFHLLPQTMLLSECLNNSKFDFSIAVNTTSYYESLIAGLPCLRFKDGEQYDMMMGDEHDEFDNKQTLTNAIDWLQSTIQNHAYDAIRLQLLRYCLGLGIDDYKKVLI